MFTVPAIMQHHPTVARGVGVLRPVGSVANLLAEGSFSMQVSFGTRGIT